jgi:hypothetical protein
MNANAARLRAPNSTPVKSSGRSRAWSASQPATRTEAQAIAVVRVSEKAMSARPQPSSCCSGTMNRPKVEPNSAGTLNTKTTPAPASTRQEAGESRVRSGSCCKVSWGQ